MALTIPDSLKAKQGETIAIKASDWNAMHAQLDDINSWRKKTFIPTVPDGWCNSEGTYCVSYAIEPVSITSGLPTYNNVDYNEVKPNDVIYASHFNDLKNKISILNNTGEKLPEAKAQETLISADLFQQLENKYEAIALNFSYTFTIIETITQVTILGILTDTNIYYETQTFTYPNTTAD